MDAANDLALRKAEGKVSSLPIASSRAARMGGTDIDPLIARLAKQIYSRGNRIVSGAPLRLHREHQPKRARRDQRDRQNQNGLLQIFAE